MENSKTIQCMPTEKFYRDANLSTTYEEGTPIKKVIENIRRIDSRPSPLGKKVQRDFSRTNPVEKKV